jgi:hypothetical protein
MCCSFVAVMHAPSLVEFHFKVRRVLVVVFAPLIMIYNSCSIMALPCLLSEWLELSPTSSNSISFVAYKVWVWFFPFARSTYEMLNFWGFSQHGPPTFSPTSSAQSLLPYNYFGFIFLSKGWGLQTVYFPLRQIDHMMSKERAISVTTSKY